MVKKKVYYRIALDNPLSITLLSKVVFRDCVGMNKYLFTDSRVTLHRVCSFLRKHRIPYSARRCKDRGDY